MLSDTDVSLRLAAFQEWGICEIMFGLNTLIYLSSFDALKSKLVYRSFLLLPPICGSYDSSVPFNPDIEMYDMIATYISTAISALAIALVLHDRWTRWKNRKPLLYHEGFSDGKLHRYRQVRFLIWDENGHPMEVDAPEDSSPGFVFTLLSRSSEPIEIYDISFGNLNAREPHGERLKSSVPLPYVLKAHDYRSFQLAVIGEYDKSQLIYTWNNRKSLWTIPVFSIRFDVKVRTSRGTVTSSIRGFSKFDNFRTRLNFKLSFLRAKAFKSNTVRPVKLLLDRSNWWE